MKDAARLVAYFAATILFGALAAPLLYWAAQALAAHGIFSALARFDFESFFHRALMLGAIVFLWPLLRWLGIKTRRDLELEPNRRWLRDLIIGFLLSALPVLLCEIFLVARGFYSVRTSPSWNAIAFIVPSAVVVPFIEEALFRGLFLGVLTLGELREGVEAKRRNDAATAARLEAWVDDIETTLADRVLPVDVAAARLWGELSARRSPAGDRYADRSHGDYP